MDIPRAVERLLQDLCDISNVNLESLNVARSALADMQHKNRIEFNSALQNNDLGPLFDTLSRLGGEESSEFCEIVHTLLECVPPHQLLTRYEDIIMDAIRNVNDENIQRLTLQQLSRCARDKKVFAIMLERPALLALIIDRMASTALYGYAQKVLLDLTASSRDAVKAIFGGELLKRLEQVQEAGSVEKIRVYSLYFQVAVQSDENCILMKPQLEAVINSLQAEKSDVLILLNYIELLSTLVANTLGRKFLLNTNVITICENLLNNHTDSMASLYIPGVLIFFGDLGYHEPNVLLRDFPSVVSSIFGMFPDTPYAAAAMASISQLARSDEGKRSLERTLPLAMLDFIRGLGDILESARPADLKHAALAALGVLIELEDFDRLDVLAITEKWLTHLSTSPLQLLWTTAKVPFEVQRVASLRVLRGVALLPWGRQELLKFPGFLEWLLDRGTEPEKAGKECKFEIVAALLEEANTIGDSSKVSALRKFFHEGPFYSPEDVAVTTDDV